MKRKTLFCCQSVPHLHNLERTITRFCPMMLPASSSDVQTQKKPPKMPNPVHRSLNSVLAHVSSRPWISLFIAFFLIEGLVIVVTRGSQPSFPERTATVSSSAAADPAPPAQIQEDVVSNGTHEAEPTPPSQPEECPLGRIYVYDLPSVFNEEQLLHNCTDLQPHNWQCGIATNRGFGRPATELRRILPDNLSESWYRTNQFSLEVIFHLRVLKHKCRTLEPDSASAFYIPFYVGLAVGKYLWIDDIAKRDLYSNMMLDWVTKQKYWNKSNVSDHVMAVGRITWDFRRLTDPEQKWGSSLFNLPEMRKVTRFIIEKSLDDDNEVAVPYPTGFHPKTRNGLNEWQNFVRNCNRSSLFTFIGATRSAKDDFRGLLQSHCSNETDSCRLVDCSVAQCSTDSSVVLEALLGSEFCLQPIGDSFTRKSVFDCMVAGSVPVFFWMRTAYDQYEGFLPGLPESYSVYIDHEEVRNGTSVKQVLMRYSKEDVRRMREKVIEIIPRIIYGMQNEGMMDFKDAVDISIDGFLERVKEDKYAAYFL